MTPERVALALRGTCFEVRAADVVRPSELELRLQRRRGGRSGAQFDVRGTLRVADEPDADVRGSLELRLWPRPAARWELELASSGETPFGAQRVRGDTQPKWLVPIDSLTRLWLRFEGEGGVVALGLLRFDVRRDLLPLLDGFASRLGGRS